MQSIPLRSDIIPVANITWPDSDGGGSSEVGFADGVYFLDHLAPMEDSDLLATLDDEGVITWATPAVRDWYYNSRLAADRPAVPPPGALRIGGLASALLVLGYVMAAWSCLGLLIVFLMDRDVPLTVFAVLWELVIHPFVWGALIASWAADMLISGARQSSEKSLAIVIGGSRFIHGPVVTIAFALCAVAGIASALL